MTESVTPLAAELATAAERLRASDAGLRSLLDMGVDAGFLCTLYAQGLIGIGQVSLGRDGLYEPEGPDRRLLLGVCDEFGELADVVALASHDRDQWALRRKAAPVLGVERIDWAMMLGLPLRIYGRPLDWLAAQRDGNGSHGEAVRGGICVLDWTPESLGRLRGLGPAGVLRCDPGAAEKLRGMLAFGGLPRVETARVALREAA